MRHLILPIAILSSGCPLPDDAGKTYETCDEDPSPPAVAVCVAPVGGWPDGEEPRFGGSLALDLFGLATEVGDGVPPDGCFDADHAGVLDDAADAWWFRAPDADGAIWTVGVRFPAVARPVEAGQEVRFAYAWSAEFQWENEEAEVTLRDFENALVLWVSQGGTADLWSAPAELAVSEGAMACAEQQEADDPCPPWARFAIEVGPKEIAYGAAAAVDRYHVVNAGYARVLVEDQADDVMCDWYAPPYSWLIGAAVR